MFGAVITFIWK